MERTFTDMSEKQVNAKDMHHSSMQMTKTDWPNLWVDCSLDVHLGALQHEGQGAFQKHVWALKSKSSLNFSVMGKIFCVEFQRVPSKFHTKYLAHTLKDVDFIHM